MGIGRGLKMEDTARDAPWTACGETPQPPAPWTACGETPQPPAPWTACGETACGAPVIFDDQEGMCVRQVDGSLDHEFHEFSRMKRGLRGRLQDLDGFVPIRVIRGLRSIFLTTNLTNFHE
jgi:hypothetical protein